MVLIRITMEFNKSNHIFNTVVTFGDANTDTGNVYRLTNNRWPLVPPYYQGRFSNNLIWIDRLNIPTLKNFAYGDATIDNDNLFIGYTEMNRTEVPGIRQQIVSYLAANEINTVDLSHTLYILWASGNEYLINSNVSSHVVVKTFLTAVYDLLVLGINQLVIFNIPPLQLYPGMMNDSRLYNLITEHNHCLLSNITQIQLEYPQTSIELFDVNSLLTTILSNQSLYHLNTTDKCWL
ncbi:hypothetical protein I4U23_002919 [Adineta vaga]|nr:hypothetical protein I4U23_002919 [Adineta vaga]